MSSKLRIISYGEIVAGDGQKEKQCIFHHLRKIINAKQEEEVRFCLSHKELNTAEGTDQTLQPALYRRELCVIMKVPLYKIHDNLSTQKLIRVSGYFSHNYMWSNSFNVCADLPGLQAQRQQNVMDDTLISEQSPGAERCVGNHFIQL